MSSSISGIGLRLSIQFTIICTYLLTISRKHGLPRPTLMGMVKSNQSKLVLRCMAEAIAALPTADPMLAPDEAFPKASLDALDSMRGVGPATASLILSIFTACGDPDHEVPFYSDDMFLWLCLLDFPETKAEPKKLISSGSTDTKQKDKLSKFKRPNGELIVKYNVAEYRKLWNASWELQKRMNRAIEAEIEAKGEDAKTSDIGATVKTDEKPDVITHIDIEKVAYVLRNIAVSGYYPDIDPEELLQAHAGQVTETIAHAQAEKNKKKDSGGAGKKRKRSEKDDSKKKESRNSKKSKRA